MRHLFNRPIGKILLDGKFLSSDDLENALEEQKKTRELLGQVLVRMGVINERDFNAPLLIQKHLNHIEDAVKVAAGERQLLGILLVESGHITSFQLEQAIAEQKRTGEKLGEVFIRLGLLTQRQLTALLDFQQNQAKPSDSPLRLGELLIATGHITRLQLNQALRKQTQNGKKLGEVLIEEGYVRPGQVRHGMSLQKKLIGAVLAAVLSLGMSSVASARSVDLQWDPNTDTNLAGYKVYFTATPSALEEAEPIDVQNQTMATINGLDPTKTYTIAVTAYDTSGVESTYSNIISLASDATPPTVAVTSPADAVTVSGAVLINLNAADNDAVTRVELYINGVLTSVETVAPYTYSWDTSALTPGTYSLTAKAYDAAGNVGQANTITVSVGQDTIAPTVTLTAPASNSVVSGTVPLTAGASDNIGVSKVEIYANGILLFVSNASPYSFNWDTTTVTNGAYSIFAKAYDAAGNIAQSALTTVTVSNIAPDTTAPVLTAFVIPPVATSLSVPVTSFSACDNVGIVGYLITESPSPPSNTAVWSSTPPSSFTFSGNGVRTAYAWVKDAAGNISASMATVTITLPDTSAPALSAFTMPSTSASLTVPVSSFTASDNVGITGYFISESPTVPSATSVIWSASAPTSFTFSGTGVKTAYAWVKDAADNISSVKSATVTITLDTTAPKVVSFNLPNTSTTLTVPVSTFTASDNVGVTSYMITESSIRPTVTTLGWSPQPPTSFTFSAKGTKIAYAWVKDAAGNIAGKAAKVTIK